MSWRTRCRGLTMRAWSQGIRDTANTSTLHHVPRVRVFLGWLLRPDSVRGAPRVYSSGRTANSQRPWPLWSLLAAGRQ
eukprot:2556882-Pleurochrysis_carterae.AAC.1